MEIKLNSKLKDYMLALMNEREKAGFGNQDFFRLKFEDFDRFTIDNNFDNGTLSEEQVETWCLKKTTEDRNSRNKRVGVIKKLAEYMISIGIETYCPRYFGSIDYTKPYVPTRKELRDFFNYVDSYKSDVRNWEHTRKGISVLFRLYYFLGMRLQEGIMLKRKDVDFTVGTILIRHSKGDKDRILYLKEDMISYLKEFDDYMQTQVQNREWFFLRRDKTTHFTPTFIDKKFHFFWLAVFPNWKGKRPTIHSLRHAFVVHRVNDWVESGRHVEEILPYLSRFLGHRTIEDTFYYYHSYDTESGAFSKFIENASELSQETLEWLD